MKVVAPLIAATTFTGIDSWASAEETNDRARAVATGSRNDREAIAHTPPRLGRTPPRRVDHRIFQPSTARPEGLSPDGGTRALYASGASPSTRSTASPISSA